jgi:hypothetical protein
MYNRLFKFLFLLLFFAAFALFIWDKIIYNTYKNVIHKSIDIEEYFTIAHLMLNAFILHLILATGVLTFMCMHQEKSLRVLRNGYFIGSLLLVMTYFIFFTV